MGVGIVVTVLGLHGVAREQHAGLGGAINGIGQDCVFDLQVEKALNIQHSYMSIFQAFIHLLLRPLAYQCNILDDFLRNVFRIEFGTEFELQRIFFLLFDVLIHNLNK